MLSSLGRVALRRLASSSVATSPRWVVGLRPAAGVACRPPRTSPVVRTYATASSAQKAPAKKSTSKKSGAAAKKPAAKKSAPKKKVAKKPTTKPTNGGKAPKKPETKNSIMLRERAERKELKEKALLDAPAELPATAWNLMVKESMAGTGASISQTGDLMRNLAASYKSLSVSERERLDKTAAENKLNNEAAYKAWIESHPVAAVHEAKLARATLKRKYKFVPKGRQLTDDRIPKQPSPPFTFFVRARWGSGDFSGVGAVEATKKMAEEWRAVPETDRQPYIDLSHADGQRYAKEVRHTLGREVKSKSPSPP